MPSSEHPITDPARSEPRRRGRWLGRRWALLVAVVATLAFPAAAFAGHLFIDVEHGSVHEPGIEYLAGTGITTGCATDPDRFCPGDALTRAQMATFLFRESGHDPATPPSVNAASVANIVIVQSDNTVGAGSTANPNTVACPAGTVAVGGGGTAPIGWVLKDSNPLDGGTGWRVQHRTADGAPVQGNATNTVYAICVPGNVAP